MDNVITITLKDGQDNNRHAIEFESTPTLSELVAAKLVIDEALEYNFRKEEIISEMARIYPRLSDLEEITRGND